MQNDIDARSNKHFCMNDVDMNTYEMSDLNCRMGPILHHRGITWHIFTWENLYSTYTTAKKYKRWTKYIITTPKCETLQPWANASQGYANQSNVWQFVSFLKEIEATVAMDMAWGGWWYRVIDLRFPGQVMSAAMTTMGMEACNRLVDFFSVFLYRHFPLPALSVCNLSTGSHPKALLVSREILPRLPPNICLPMIIVVYIQQVLNSMPTLRSYKCRGIATFEQI